MKPKWFLCLLLLLLLTGCGQRAQDRIDEEKSSLPSPASSNWAEQQESAVSGVTLSEASLTLTEGEEAVLTAQTFPENMPLQWGSSAPEVAEVSAEGEITAHAPGTCTITVWCPDCTEAQAACEITVNRKPYLVVLDAGHQRRGNADPEPVGPGASQQKAKVSSGTQGVSTGIPEYELNLQIALMLETELRGRGYEVIQTRRSHDVDLSNVQRAGMANEHQADAVLHLHANGSENASAQGAMTICMTPENPYSGALYPQSKALAQSVVDHMCSKTGAEHDGVWETDTMSGINWSQVPVTIVEIGYLTNPEEEARLADESYRKLVVQGIADGLDAYFGGT